MSRDKSAVFKLYKIIDYQADSVVSKQIIKAEKGNVTLFSFDKGQGLSEHKVSFDVLVTILDGKAEIYIEGRPFLMEQGDSLILPADKPHQLKAVQKFKMMLVMIES